MSDDAHDTVITALDGSGDEEEPAGLYSLRLGDLNDQEREHALDAIEALQELDKALAQRSSYPPTEDPSEATTNA